MFGNLEHSSPEKPVAVPTCQEKSGGPRQRAFAIPGRPATSKICRLRAPGRPPPAVQAGGAGDGFLADRWDSPIGKQIQNFAATALSSKKNPPARRAAIAGEGLVWNGSRTSALHLHTPCENRLLT